MLNRVYVYRCVFFFQQKTAYEVRISDWSSDVCSSDLRLLAGAQQIVVRLGRVGHLRPHADDAVLAVEDDLAVRRHARDGRSEERRVGQERVSTGRSRGRQ